MKATAASTASSRTVSPFTMFLPPSSILSAAGSVVRGLVLAGGVLQAEGLRADALDIRGLRRQLGDPAPGELCLRLEQRPGEEHEGPLVGEGVGQRQYGVVGRDFGGT